MRAQLEATLAAPRGIRRAVPVELRAALPHSQQRSIAERERHRAGRGVDREILQLAPVRLGDENSQRVALHSDAKGTDGSRGGPGRGQANLGRPRSLDQRAVGRN